MRRMMKVLTIGLILAACGSTADVATNAEGGEAEAPTTVPTNTTVAASTTEVVASSTTATVESTTLAPDPCADDVQAGSVSTTINVLGEDRPLYLEWDRAAAEAERPGLVIAFHAGGRKERRYTSVDPVRASVDPARQPTVVVLPRASDAAAPFWSETPDFNREYVEALFDHLHATVCFDPEAVFLVGQGQGNVVSTTVICDTDIPIRSVLQDVGLVSFPDCDPSRAVPITSFNVIDFNPVVGQNWNSVWQPTVEVDADRTGGIGPTPEDADEWAEVYGCVGEPESQVFPDPLELLHQPIEGYYYWDCDAPILSFALPAQQDGPDCGCVDPNWVAVAGPEVTAMALQIAGLSD